MTGKPATVVGIDRLADFADRIDVRSPAEFALDHVPGARSHPVLDDAERARIGTLHQQDSAFAAKKAGAALVARNIAAMLESAFAGQPRAWRPLVYCWRGGKRSGALTHVLNEIGWKAVQLEGGYKAYRRHVIDELSRLPQQFSYRVICGVTGSGKSRLLLALERAGAQVLDLEVLAAHRGSVLGELPDAPQPTQKSFETSLWTALSSFDPARPVFVESESKKVGNLRVPDALIARMRESKCLRLEADTASRVALLMEDYAHFVERPEALAAKLDCLAPLHGAERIDAWKDHLGRGEWNALVRELLESHYDPAYRRSLFRNYVDAQAAAPVEVRDISRAGFVTLARRLARDHG